MLPSIDDARALVLARVRPPAPEPVAVEQALGRALAEDVAAEHDIPRFANSAMDGFAVLPGPARTVRLVGESRAGAPFDRALREGEAIRVSTGGQVPDGAAVLQQELVDAAGDEVVLREDVPAGRNVRFPGEDLRAGTTVLRAGTLLGPAEVGVAVAAGRATVACAPTPRVAVLATGDELRPPGTPLGPGELHETNALTLGSLARLAGARVVQAGVVGDDPGATREALAAALEAADVLVCSGGVSVGPHDHVKPALEALEVEEVFWKVALRPGRPTWFGVRDHALVFGLPGNPVSAMVTFLLFARPAIRALQGLEPTPPRGTARLGEAIARHPDRDECVRVRLADGVATPSGPQGSHQLTSMLGADALAIVPRGAGELTAGAEVAVEPLR
jgi:molybdopterin molybdotransferase